MSVRIVIPAQLRSLTRGDREAAGEPASLGEVLSALEQTYPDLRQRLRYDETGELRRSVNLYVNGDNVRFLQGKHTKLADGDELRIVLAVAGG